METSMKVQAGARFLDELADNGVIRKDWHVDVDTEILDMQGAYSCILGQVFGSESYDGPRSMCDCCDDDSVSGYAIGRIHVEEAGEATFSLGFNTMNSSEWDALHREWTEEILNRSQPLL